MAAIKKTKESGKAVTVKTGTLKRPPAGKKPVKSKAANGSKSPTGNRKPADVGTEDGLNPGTVIGVDRGLYKHYGIYAGRASVIHYASATGDFGDEMSVRKTGVKHFLNGAANFFVCEFPDAHGRPSESRRDEIGRASCRKRV